MTPEQFYALPSQSRVAWYEATQEYKEFFAESALWLRVREHEARREGANDLVFERKLRRKVELDRTNTLDGSADKREGPRAVTYLAVVFRGQPVGILVTAGRGPWLKTQRAITDIEGYAAARAYVDRFVPKGPDPSDDLVDRAAAAGVFEGFYGHSVVSREGGAKVVASRHLADDGTLLFDQEAYEAAFANEEASVGSYDCRRRPPGKRLQGSVVRALLGSVPEGIEASAEFGEIPDYEGTARAMRWTPLVISGPDGTYAFGVDEFPDGTGFEFTARRVGPPELYAELTGSVSPAP